MAYERLKFLGEVFKIVESAAAELQEESLNFEDKKAQKGGDNV